MKKIYTTLGKPKNKAARKPRKTVAEWKAEISKLQNEIDVMSQNYNAMFAVFEDQAQQSRDSARELAALKSRIVSLPFGFGLVKKG